ncbi:hypothetical protein [Actinocorallia populi]|uniref:hypothetical protein n=1 Tax=Actinocorallia populi TaxID=2079200 RepID=UPI000D089164|nr:hypothetical protein [Actinocorallia populi]
MIILSGLLVIVAIALLVAGIITEEQGVLGLNGLQLIYVSIAVSIVSFLCLAIGVLIRRKELFGTGPSRPAVPKSRPAGRAARRAAARAEEAAAVPEPEDGLPQAFPTPAAQVPDDALVHVVPGRKRYHLDTCRQLAGRQVEELTYVEAQEEGFSPCTACLPDTALAARATAVAAGDADADPEDGLSTEPRIGVEEPRGEGGGRFEPTRSFEAPASPTSSYEIPSYESYEAASYQAVPSYEPDAGLPPEGSGAHPTAGAPEWSPDPSGPPAADTVTDWDPKALTAEPIDPLDPAYPVPDAPYTGPSPLEPRQSGDSWSSPAADPFRAESGDAAPEQGDPLPEAPSATSTLSDSVLSEPVRPAAEHAPAEPERAEPAAAPAPQAGAPAEESLTGGPVVPGSRESEEGPGAPVVRILSGTKRYHRPDCALIEDIGEEDEDLETLSRATAEERGCTPCLVCQPDREPAV